MINRWAFCECISGSLSVKQAMADLFGKFCDFIWSPNIEEASDICFAIGRLVGGIIGEQYIRIPGDEICLMKLQERLQLYGCVKNPRKCSIR